MRRRTWAYLLAVLAGSTGCATTSDPTARGPKVLLEWAEPKPPRSENAEADNADPMAEGEDVIVTDRPDFTEASSTVGKGRVQLEAGYTYTGDRANGEKFSSHSYPEALLRIGMFADWFELRVGQNFGNEQTTRPNGTRALASGADDLYLGVKLGLTEQKDWRPEMALVLQMTVPTGSPDFSAQEVLPGLNLLYGWDVIEEKISVGGSTQANRVRGEFALPGFMGLDEAFTGTHSYLLVAQSLTVNYTLTEKLGAYTEWFALIPHSAVDPAVGPEQYFDGGLTYKVTPLFQVDVRAGVGLNRHAADYFAGSGFAVKY